MEEKLIIKCGFACNNNCVFCGCMEDIRGYNKTTKQIMGALKKFSSRREVVFSGGEPTIRKDIFELARYAKRLGYKIIKLQTNGRMLSYTGFCKEAVNSGFNSFLISLYSSDEQTQDYLTQSKDSFKQIVRAIENLQGLNQEIFVEVVIVKQNYKDLPKITKFLIDNGISNFQFSFVRPLGKANKNFDSVVPRLDETIDYVKESLILAEKHEKNLTLDAIPVCLMEGYENRVRDDYFFHPTTYHREFLTDNINRERLSMVCEIEDLIGEDILSCLKNAFEAVLNEDKDKMKEHAAKTVELIKQSRIDKRSVNSLYYIVDIILLLEKEVYSSIKGDELKEDKAMKAYSDLKRLMEMNFSCFLNFDLDKLTNIFTFNDSINRSLATLDDRFVLEKLKYMSCLMTSFGREVILINNLQPERYTGKW